MEMMTQVAPSPKTAISFSAKKQALADFLREELRRKGITHARFAEIMEKKRPAITKWLSGRHNFTLDTIFEIESKLRINLLQLDNNSLPTRGQGLSISVPMRSFSSTRERLS